MKKMAKKLLPVLFSQPLRNRCRLIPRSPIKEPVQRIARQFKPERIILFGSYARDTARPDSDLDLFVVMPAWNEIDQSLRIENALDVLLPLDIVVRTPK